ncbi:MAG: hypothetical protein ACLFWB_00995 [Armatimonadota bacterium]
MRRFCTIAVAAVVVALCTSIATAGLFDDLKDKIPTDKPDPKAEAEEKAKEKAREELRLQIPDLGRILNEDPAITTTFEDAITGVPFLDDFEPLYTAPLSELPVDPDGGYLLAAPGTYEMEAQSYCLHAGAYAPGSGDGYLTAELKGSAAKPVTDILRKSLDYPNIPQTNIQSLIWGIQAKTKISDMPRELQDAAETLLTDDQLRKLNGGALGLVPEELYDQAFVDLPDPLRKIKEAEAGLRSKLTSATDFDYGELEEIAIRPGEAPRTGEGPEVPLGRWSFDADGFFVRYFPHGYSRTTMQVIRPQNFIIEADDLGRIVSIADLRGRSISIEYDDAIAPMSCTHDDKSHGYAFQTVRLSWPDPDNPAWPLSEELRDTGWTLQGVPTERGRPNDPADRYDDARDRYEWGKRHHQQIMELAGQFEGAPDRHESIENLVDLGHLSVALEALFDDGEHGDGNASRLVKMVSEAWQAELSGLLAPETAAETTWRTPHSPGGMMLATSSLDGTMLAWRGGGSGSRGRSGRCGGGGSGAIPARNGPQRLGVSPRPYNPGADNPNIRPIDEDERNDDGSPNGSSGKTAIENAKKAIDWINKGKTAVDLLTDPVSGAMGLLGLDIPGGLFGKILDFNFDAWGKASEALGGDPPRDDYTEIAQRQPVDYPDLPTEVASEIPAARAAALNYLMDAFSEQMSTFNAAQVTLDRLGGAFEAGDEEWIDRQGALLVSYKHRAGGEMVAIADAMDAYLQALADEGITEIHVSGDDFRAYQQRLQTEGFSDTELEAARTVGFSDADIQHLLQQRMSFDPDEEAGNVLEAWQTAAAALRDLGQTWMNLPDAT